ncbi:MAG: hypothetical protein WCF98_11270 [Synechococcus sp. ELA057]|jgi:hypothetical protein
MAPAARAVLLAWLIGFAAPGIAGPITDLQLLAGRCFETPGTSTCGSFFDLSDRLKQQAERRSQLRCYTSLLTLEAVASKALRGIQEPARQAQALQETAGDCP